ncbi:ExbD/TolR family protein [Motiliproteus sediminis]|uniref:ExbD/TolR family protein n=1 Tax=Motiliproteus sediminis TaxID=1468178 RepID=UPI001AEF6EA5|nr:biopolymer transporter ExbD [Motiliproteus sediminis]
MSRRRQRRQGRHETPEINITAFMNLMVVLIPFLLLTAAFNQLTILELYLPQVGAPGVEEKTKLPELEVILRADSLTLQDRKNRKTYHKQEVALKEDYDYHRLQASLQPIKRQYPQLSTITVLAEPGIPYERLIAVMDHIRAVNLTQDGQLSAFELFPDIALGDAPAQQGKR